MASFNWKENIEDFLKDGLIITAITTGIFFALKTASLKPPMESLDAMDIMKIAAGICGEVLMKIMQSTKNGSTSDAIKILWTYKGNKITFQWLKSRWDW